MRKIPKELMRPIKEKDPEKIASEKMRRLTVLKEALGITAESTDSEFLNRLIDAVVFQRDQRGKQKGLRIKSALSNLQRMVKISYRNHSGRAKNQVEAAEFYGISAKTFQGLREKHQDRWRYIQEKMSGCSIEERELKKTCKETLSKVTAEKRRLADYRQNLITEKDKMPAPETDQTAVLDDQILLYEILIAEQDDLYRQLQELAEIDMEEIIAELAERHIVVPQ